MAVEIKEIVIRAVLTNHEKQPITSAQTATDRVAFIQECVEQVLKALKKKNLR